MLGLQSCTTMTSYSQMENSRGSEKNESQTADVGRVEAQPPPALWASRSYAFLLLNYAKHEVLVCFSGPQEVLRTDTS